MAHDDHVPEKAQPNGLATLDVGGKVPTDTQIDHGTQIGQLVRLQDTGGVAAIPSVSGENLTNLPQSGGADPPGVRSFGSVLNYPVAGGATSGEVQYARVDLTANKTYDRMLFFVDKGGKASRNVRLGVYDQANPVSASDVPRDRLAQTAVTSTDVADGTYIVANLVSPFVVPASGFYWLAIITDSGALKFNVTASTYRSGLLPTRREVSTGTNLPASTGTLTNPTSAVIYVALVEQGVVI